MAEKIKKNIITLGRSTYMSDLGRLEVRSVGKPYTYEVTVEGVKQKVTGTKIKVLNEEKDEFLTVSVLREVKPDEFKRGDVVDFINFSITIEAAARNGYDRQPATGWLELGYKADEIMKIDDNGNFVENKNNKKDQKDQGK